MMAIRFRVGSWRSIDQLDINSRLTRIAQPPIDLRNQTPILVIDDQPFAPQHNLESNGFRLTVIADISNIKIVEPYAVVLCDLMGVGANLHNHLQGAHVIREIKNNYPDKIVFAYTGGATESRVTREANVSADYYLKKDVDIADWCQKLDSAITDLANPISVWQKFRLRLLEAGVTPLQLADMEDAFVRNYRSGPDKTRARIEDCTTRSKLSTNVQAVVQSFVASVLFKLIFA